MNTGSTTFDTPLDSTLTLTSSWQRFTYTFTVPTASGMTTPASDSKVYISIHQAAGDTGTAAWELNLTGVQLEVGKVATDFEHRSYGEELALCQRYYYKTAGTTGYLIGRGNGTSNLAGVHIPTLTSMRTTPSVTILSGTWYAIDSNSYVNGTSIGVSSIVLGGGHLKVQFSSLSGLTDNRMGMIQLPGYTIDAEL